MLRARFVVRPNERQSLGLLLRQRKRPSSSASGQRNFDARSFARGCRAARIAGGTMHRVPKRLFRRDVVGNTRSADISLHSQLPHLESSAPRRESTFFGTFNVKLQEQSICVSFSTSLFCYLVLPVSPALRRTARHARSVRARRLLAARRVLARATKTSNRRGVSRDAVARPASAVRMQVFWLSVDKRSTEKPKSDAIRRSLRAQVTRRRSK
jgi:hypothetical protein